MDSFIQVPKYDGKESLTKYLRRVDAFKLKLQEDKYRLLLNFINDWLKLSKEFKLKSLGDFINMEESILLKDPSHNRDILRKYSDTIIKKLNVKFDVDEDTLSDDIDDKYIITFLSKALTSIDFTMNKKNISNKTYYSIKFN